MGYDVWVERKPKPITFAEWRELIASDDDLEDCTTEIDGQIEGADMAGWDGPNPPIEQGVTISFQDWDGRIVIKNPGDDCIEKLKDIARRLGGIVVGDHGETYD